MNEQPAWVPYLKVAVVVMGVLIVLGLIGLGYMLYQRSQKQAAEDAPALAAASDAPAGAAASAPSPASLGLPRGSRVTRMTTTDDRLVLSIRVPAEGERIVIIDLRKGSVIGHVALENGAP
ncbi:MAG: pilus assembly protein TadG-related protein [Alphaproteobacteria bacterium]